MRRRRFMAVGAVLFFLMLLLTVFKLRTPRIDVLSSPLDGVSPGITSSVITIELNISFSLSFNFRILISCNCTSFRHGSGEWLLYYRRMRVGEAKHSPQGDPGDGIIIALRQADPPDGQYCGGHGLGGPHEKCSGRDDGDREPSGGSGQGHVPSGC
ncbi:hypothetical protein CRG98_046502 [Punica granatum]|uniref:Uncharacterized protein n=1 Tax=Punica granatum TaxID=22663 RepID=A0A2I0HMZ2_PUNGR|nr:hypothetical protein CRG98_046502 [Punica granatum]